MAVRRQKLYYNIGSLETPLVPGSNNADLATFVITDGPTVTGNADRYGNLLDPNTNVGNQARVFQAVTGLFVPSSIAASGSVSTAEDYGFFYNKAVSATVAPEAVFPFDTDGPFTSGFLHTASPTVATSAPITIVNAGTYLVEFTVGVSEARQVCLFLDGAAVTSTIYGGATGTVVTTGIAIITVTAGQVLTLRNHTSAAALTLTQPAGGTAVNNTNSLTIKRLGVSAGPSLQGMVSLKWKNAATSVAIDDPALVREVSVTVNVQGLSGGSIAGTLYIQKQASIEA